MATVRFFSLGYIRHIWSRQTPPLHKIKINLQNWFSSFMFSHLDLSGILRVEILNALQRFGRHCRLPSSGLIIFFLVVAHRVVRRRGSHILLTIGSQMAVRLSALRAGCPLPSERFLMLISVRGWVGPRAMVRLEGLDQLNNPVTSSEIEPATFRLVAYRLNQLR
jgi:hypothetical protein